MEKRIEHMEDTIRVGNILIKKIKSGLKSKKELVKFYDYIIDNISTIVSLFPSEILIQICTLINKHRENNFLMEKKYDVIIDFVNIEQKISGLCECDCNCGK